MFQDRREAGRKLAAELLRYKAEEPVVVALPRGGVPVAYEVASALGVPLDVVIVRKLGAPGQAELGIGAVVDGDHPQVVLNPDLMREIGVSEKYLQREVRRELDEIHRRQAIYRSGRPSAPLEGRTVIVVDDGIATGGSTRAALRGIRRSHPKRLILAVPVAPADTIAMLRGEVDQLVCLSTPEPFGAVGGFYHDFEQVSDEEVVRLLDRAHAALASGRGTDGTRESGAHHAERE